MAYMHPTELRLVGCPDCTHFRWPGVCAAFPRGIPTPILNGDVDHMEPFPGDNGIVFEFAGEGEPIPVEVPEDEDD